MKVFVFLLLSLFANLCFSVAWEEISKQDIAKRGISVDVRLNENSGCYKFKILLPEIVVFNELGERRFWSAKYKVVAEQRLGWQLTSKGTQIDLPSMVDNQSVKIDSLCISNNDLENAYLSVIYGGPEGTPPMVIVLALKEYRRNVD